MDQFFDDFIAYENQQSYKYETLAEPKFSLDSPFSGDSDVTSLFPSYIPTTIKNLLDTDEQPSKESAAFQNNLSSNKGRPFQIRKRKKEDGTEPSEATDPSEAFELYSVRDEDEKLISLSKKISKQEKPKEKPRNKKNIEDILTAAESKFIPEGFYDPNIDDKTRKKMIQMIRNRVSAQNSRDKKKMYVQQLEQTNSEYEQENEKLKKEKEQLLGKIQKLEKDYANLLEKHETLRNSGNLVCSKCACALEVDSLNPNINAGTATESSTASSPLLHRAQSPGRSFFGFSLAFAAVICLFLVMNGNQFGDLFVAGGGAAKTTTVMALARKLATQFDMGTCQKEEEPPKLQKVVTTEEFESTFRELQFGGFPILNKIKPLMDQFEKHHETLFQTFESDNNNIINLSQNKTFEKAISSGSTNTTNTTNTNSFKRPFLAKKPIVAAKNKTSTLFCPNGFEFFSSNQKMEAEEEKETGFAGRGLGPRSRTLDLEQAEYVQLLIPKHSIGRLGISENSSETNAVPAFQQNVEEENTLIEVWCKIFAIRDLAVSF